MVRAWEVGKLSEELLQVWR